ncbi:MAG: DUF1501 domain-containing protein [Planctomycetota bacterium]|nr:MAG: DUF1501 domain-containing protein [Planctomycetota bacterium]REK24637.1 MAG: DUF1501 domain-containing protein [Planctomycetota bacterium]REK32429.1 MAG: DUF1501 domain-containing protein [Planctomycetota bacterium]
MLRIFDRNVPLCDGVSRREWLRVGSLGLSGLSLPHLLASRDRAAEQGQGGAQPKAKSVILFWLTGGVPQHDTWDPKPNGPDHSRSEFGAIPTRTPGLQVGALMPQTAQLTDRIAVLRAMVTGDNSHSSSGYQMLTGVPHIPLSRENALPGAPNDWPSLGALTRVLRSDKDGLPSAITLPRHIANVGEKLWPGQDAGFLGRTVDPWLLTCDPSEEDFQIPDLQLPADVSELRYDQRRGLLTQVNRQLDRFEQHAETEQYDRRTEQAISLLSGGRAREAFDLARERDTIRDRYGRSKFAQSVLLARRLVEAGTSLVQVNWQRIDDKENNGSWDTHKDHHASLKGWLMPIMDQAFSALLTDLEERGLLDETLVAWVGEFGHTPRINARAGRDHWGSVFSIALAGGGVRGGVVHGESDREAAYPISGRVAPNDYAATVLHCLGFEPETIIRDLQDRPIPISRGKVIDQVLA